MLMAWDKRARLALGSITSIITQYTVSRTWTLSHAPLLSSDRQASPEKSVPAPGRLGLLLVTPECLFPSQWHRRPPPPASVELHEARPTCVLSPRGPGEPPPMNPHPPALAVKQVVQRRGTRFENRAPGFDPSSYRLGRQTSISRSGKRELHAHFLWQL